MDCPKSLFAASLALVTAFAAYGGVQLVKIVDKLVF